MSGSRIVIAVLVCCVLALPGSAEVIHTVSGFSATGDAVSFEAHLTISGDLLAVELLNTSAVFTNSPDDLLSSYFFDVVDSGGNRPTLTYVSAVGDVWLTDQEETDELQMAGADLKAVNPGDHTWEFRAMEPSAAPFLGFGIGTVGNSDLDPNNFHGNIVGGFNYSIYAGDVSTRNLDDYALVKPSALFTFSGVSGFSETDIAPLGVFGMGTGPDTLVSTPEPATGVLLGLGGLVLRRRR